MGRSQRIGAGAVVALVAALLLAGSVAAVAMRCSFPQLDERCAPPNCSTPWRCAATKPT